MPSHFFLATKPVMAGLVLAMAALGAGVGLDIGGILAAFIGAVSAVAASLVAYGVMRGKFQAQIQEHERRLNDNDAAHDGLVRTLDAHRQEFGTFAQEIRQDVGELVGEARARKRRRIP